MAYTTPAEVKDFSKIKKEDLGYTSEQDYDTFLNTLIGYAESLINDYLGQSFTADMVPASVRFVTIQLCSNILHGILQRKISPIIQTSEFTIRLAIPEAFTEELRSLLNPHKKLTVKREDEA